MEIRKEFRVFRSILLLTTAGAVVAQTDQTKGIDEILKAWDNRTTPGAAVAVVYDGKIVFAKGYGVANMEYDIPITPNTIFHVASVSKQFTAMSLVLLEQDEKLAIDDDVHKYLPELPDYGSKITIRNLLQHTSGIRDQWQTLSLAGWRMDDVITQDQILRMLFHQKELNFPPGSQHLYSNGGYTLAAEIVKRVSGKPLPQFCEERIFKPLGMSHTHFHLDHRQIVHDRAYSYDKTNDGFRISPLNYANVGATSLFTTAPDLVTWLDNFRDPKVGGSKAVARLQEQAVLSDGKTIDYALGVVAGKHRGLRTVSHAGGDAGYRSFVVWFPDDRLGISVLSNLGNFNTANIAYKVAELYLGSKMAAAPEKAKPTARTYITVAPATLEQYAGDYQTDMGIVNIALRDGNLMGAPIGQPPAELRPVGPARFYVEPVDTEVEFVPNSGGAMTVRFNGNLRGEGKRINVVPFDRRTWRSIQARTGAMSWRRSTRSC